MCFAVPVICLPPTRWRATMPDATWTRVWSSTSTRRCACLFACRLCTPRRWTIRTLPWLCTNNMRRKICTGPNTTATLLNALAGFHTATPALGGQPPPRNKPFWTGAVLRVKADLRGTSRLTHQMQEVQMAAVLIQNVGNNPLAAPSHHVVILAAFGQIHFGTEVLAMFRRIARPFHNEGRHAVGLGPDLIAEIVFVTHWHLDADPIVLPDNGNCCAFLAKGLSHFFACGHHDLVQKSEGSGVVRKRHQITHALAPVVVCRSGARGQVQLAMRSAFGHVNLQGLQQSPHGGKQDK